MHFFGNFRRRVANGIRFCVSRNLAKQQKRFRTINIQRPRNLFYERALVTQYVTPYYPKTRPPKPLWELCLKVNPQTTEKPEAKPYSKILARECLQRIEASKMIGFLHKNSISSSDAFDLAVALHKKGMSLKLYGKSIMKLAVDGTRFEPILFLFDSSTYIVFGKEPNVKELHKITRRMTQVVLIAGILDNRLLSLNDFLKYGNLDLTEARTGLVHTLRTAGGVNLNRQLTHHQSTLVSRLDQISKLEVGQVDSKEPKDEA